MPTITDATVVNAAYDTSGNGGRKLVRLSNEILIAGAKTSSGFVIYKSADNGATWSAIYTYTAAVIDDFSLSTVNNRIYLTFNTSANILWAVLTDSGTLLQGLTYLENLNSQSAISKNSSVINEAGTELHAAWASKNSTYPNSFNIRYAKGTIAADGSVTWSAAEQLSTLNNSAINLTNPSVILDGTGNPQIYCGLEYDSYDGILVFNKKLTTTLFQAVNGWNNTHVYNGGTYAQSNPSAIFVPQSINGLANGRIWVAWHGVDATDTSKQNIRVSYSDDGGATWSTAQKLTSGNTLNQYFPTLTANKNNEVFVLFSGTVGTDTTDNLRIRQVKNTNNVWGAVSDVTVPSNDVYPSSLFDRTFSLDFSSPLFIYKDTTNAKVGFYGTWTTTTISVTPGHIGQKTGKDSLLSYVVTTSETMSAITEKVNGVIVSTKAAISGESLIVGLTKEQWDAVRFGRYADATGGKNTLTIEMGEDKWTYTFEKRPAADADILTAVKAAKDAQEAHLPSSKANMIELLQSKGLSINANATFDEINEQIKTLNAQYATGSGTFVGSQSVVIPLNFKPFAVFAHGYSKDSNRYVAMALNDGTVQTAGSPGSPSGTMGYVNHCTLNQTTRTITVNGVNNGNDYYAGYTWQALGF